MTPDSWRPSYPKWIPGVNGQTTENAVKYGGVGHVRLLQLKNDKPNSRLPDPIQLKDNQKQTEAVSWKHNGILQLIYPFCLQEISMHLKMCPR